MTDERHAPTVLVVEDDPPLRWLMTEILAPAGYRVFAVDRVDKAVQVAIEHPVDAVVLDRNLPDGDGLRLLGSAALDDARVLVLTVRAEEADFLSAYQAGAHAYLLKPFDPQQVLVTLKRLIDSPLDELERRRDAEIARSRLIQSIEESLAEA